MYNEIDPNAAAWLEELVKQGHIRPGVVDTRSIADLDGDDVTDTQAHFFAGIGGWSYALRLAGVPDTFPVWTGSCPCQPFSIAGKGRGVKDERHLWPDWLRLIEQRRPPVLLGEQVASPAGRDWLSVVRADLEALGYAVGAADLCAAGVGAPHARQRLFWGATRADPNRPGRDGKSVQLLPRRQDQAVLETARTGGLGLGNALGNRRGQGGLPTAWGVEEDSRQEAAVRCNGSTIDDLAYCNGSGLEVGPGVASDSGSEQPLVQRDRWSDCDWVWCRDGAYRPVESGTFPLAHGIPARVGRLRGYGNAIVPQVAATFIRAFLTC